MKDFEIFNIDDNSHSMVLLLSTEDPYYLIDDVYDELSPTLGKEFAVIVDMFLRNGFSFNRFFLLTFKNESRYIVNVLNPREVSENAKFRVHEFMKNNLNLLENSALPCNVVNYIKAS